MKQSESIEKLLEALTKAQADFVTLPKDKSGYGYKYTDLDTVISNVRPILAKNQLGFMQALTTLENGKSGITTRIYSSSGEYIEDTATLPEITVGKTNAAQNMGAAITYVKRYALCAMLGISSDEDTDAVAPRTEQPAPMQPQSPQPQKTRNTQNVVKGRSSSKPQPAGGPDTADQRNEINALLGACYKNNKPIFTEAEINSVPSKRMTETAPELIEHLKATIAARRNAQPQPAGELAIEAAEIPTDKKSLDDMESVF